MRNFYLQFKNSTKTCFSLTVFLLIFQSLISAEYEVSFTANGTSEVLDNVIVENLTKKRTTILSGTDILVLNPTGTISAINEVYNANAEISIFPNPTNGESRLKFELSQSGITRISIFDITGKSIYLYTNYLSLGKYEFSIPALPSGLFIVDVNTNGSKRFEKLISVGNQFSLGGSIQLISNVSSSKETPFKRSQSLVSKKTIAHDYGDIMKFSGISGRDTTIVVDTIYANKTINFHLIHCVDANNNSYPIVKIGSLYWMTRNLKATKYNSGVALNCVKSQLNWNTLSSASEAYCQFNDNEENIHTLGNLYTYNAAASTINPEGWRLPSQAELYKMADFLGGKNLAGGQLKVTGNTFWKAPNTSANNLSGFSALAAGYRTIAGFSPSSTYAAFWTATAHDADHAYSARLDNNSASLVIDNLNKKSDALSVRYVFEVSDTRRRMLKSIFHSAADSTIPSVSNTLPLPKTSFVMPTEKELIYTVPFDASPLNLINNPNDEKTVFNIPNIPALATGDVKWWTNFKKMTTQLNANGRENTIIAVWNESEQGLNSGSKQVSLHIIGDEQTNYEHKVVKLPDYFTMPAILFGTAYNNIDSKRCYAMIAEFAQWEMQLSTGDVNDDGTPDILIAVHDQLRVYDGKTFSKISEKNFQSDHGLTSNDKAFYLRCAVHDINKDGKNDILVSTSSNMGTTTPKLHVFLDGDLATTDKNLHQIKDIVTNKNIKTANFTVGDINVVNPEASQEKTDEIVLILTASDMIQYVTYLSFSNNAFTDLAPLFYVDYNDLWMSSIVLARLKGPTMQNYIVTGNEVLGLDADNKLYYPFKQKAFTTTNKDQTYGDQVVVGNFDKSSTGREMVYFLRHYYVDDNTLKEACYMSSFYVDNENNIKFKQNFENKSDHDFNKYYANEKIPRLNYTFPVIAGVNTRHTGKVLEFVRHQYMLSNIKVDAVLAAAPYYAGYYTGGDEPSTSWGKSISQSSSSETEISHTASLILGFEQEFNLPFVGTKVGGIEMTAKISAEFSSAFSKETTVTKSIAYQAGTEDAVVVSSTPYDAYFYKVIKSDVPQQEGSELMLAFPRKPITQLLSVESYNEITSEENVPHITKSVLGHTVGLPFSYPKNTTGLSNITDDSKFTMTGLGSSTGNTGGNHLDIEIDESTSQSSGLSVGFEAELVATVVGFKIGAGYGFGNTNKQTTTVGKSTKVSGYVPGIKRTAPSDIKSFNWNLVWYNYKASGQTFYIVNYLVQPQ